MGDDCVALLEKILAETIRLRESMEAKSFDPFYKWDLILQLYL